MISTLQTPTPSLAAASSLVSNSDCKRASKFKATVLWQNLVAYIYRNVKQKRRRLILKGLAPTACFSGSDVCDTALLYLLMDNDNFKTTDLTRTKARKLCQLLLEHQVFEPLSGGTSSSLERRFDDSGNKYYKFVSSIDAAFQVVANSARAGDGFDSKENQLDSPHLSAMDGVVVANPDAVQTSQLDCGGSIMKELLGLTNTDSTPGSALKDSNGKHGTATRYVRRIYNEHVMANKRSTLDCEAAFTHGTFPRTISAGTGIAGVFKRKRSALNIPGGLQEEDGEPSVDFRRSLRLRKALPELSRAKRPLLLQPIYSASNTPQSASHLQQPLQSISSQPNDDLSDEPCDGTVIQRRHSPSEETVGFTTHQSESTSKTVEKLAKLTGDVIFSPSAIAEIRQEIALSQLSQLIDLPILEGLVYAGSAGGKDEPGYDNSVFFNVDQQNTLAMGFNAGDTWVRSAIDIFDYMPNGHKTTFDYQIGVNPGDYKLALYRSILKSYRGRTEPLFPSCHEQIHVAVLGMVMAGEEQKAVLTMRLATMLLPCYLMAEVATLLEFLQVVSITSDPKLKPSLNNNDAVLNDFSAVFFMGCKILSVDQRRVLLLLMMRYCDKLIQVPASVQSTLEKTMQNIKQGDDTPTPSTMFCKKISTEQYDEQQRETTEKSIVALIKDVIDNTAMPLKDKHKRIKLFSKHHQLIMAKHFSDIA